MNANQYVNAVIKKIKCSGKKKKEIKKQLLTDINMRREQGEGLEEILSHMGSVQEIADSFNEDISPQEHKAYRRDKALKIAIPIVVALVLLAAAIYWMLPKGRDIGQSKYFEKAEVEAAMIETVERLDAGDYESLQADAIPQMKQFLNEEEMAKVRGSISDDWGEREQFGAVYLAEIVQANQCLAVGEITVTYENVSVTYRLSYDKEMRLAGLYVR